MKKKILAYYTLRFSDILLYVPFIATHTYLSHISTNLSYIKTNFHKNKILHINAKMKKRVRNK